MPNTSKRGQMMPESPIRKLVPLSDKAKARGIEVYHLNIGQPDLKTPQVALDAIRNIDRTTLEYSPSDGIRSLKTKLVKYYHGFNIDVSEEDIFVTTGGSEAVSFAFLSCLNPGDEVIIPEPAYANYSAFAIASGAVIIPVTSTIENGFALPPIEKFEELISDKTKGILICNPSNPTGSLYTETEMIKIRDLVKKHDLFLFSDEVYREFCYTDTPYISALNLKGIDDNVVLIDSISKRYSMTGVRVGNVVTKNKEVQKTIMKFCQARLSPPLLGQIAAEAAMDTPPEYMTEMFNEYIQRRDFLIEGLNRIPGVFSPMPMGAFYTIARLPIDDSDKFCSWLLSDFDYKGHTIMLAPATGFYISAGFGKDEVRLAYVLEKESLKHALLILEKALEVYPGRVK